ncbi:MAG TPA: hypothetical protein VGJ34_09610 [Gaiellaceae bacterium]
MQAQVGDTDPVQAIEDAHLAHLAVRRPHDEEKPLGDIASEGLVGVAVTICKASAAPVPC